VDPDIYISQGSVVTCLRCGGIFNGSFITRLLPSLDSKRILKIGQHLLKLLVVFFNETHGVHKFSQIQHSVC